MHTTRRAVVTGVVPVLSFLLAVGCVPTRMRVRRVHQRVVRRVDRCPGTPRRDPHAPTGILPFESDAQVAAAVGRTVYAVTGGPTDGDRQALRFGDPLLLCSGVTMQLFVRVKDDHGRRRNVEITFLSRRPPVFDFDHPGTAPRLAAALFEEARHDQSAGASLSGLSQTWMTRAHEVYTTAAERSAAILERLVEGSGPDRLGAEESIYGQMPWTARAQDPNIARWFAAGIPDRDGRTRYQALVTCLRQGDAVSQQARKVAHLQHLMHDKPWLQPLAGAPPARIARVDAANMRELTAKLEKAQRHLAAEKASPACSQARALAAQPPPSPVAALGGTLEVEVHGPPSLVRGLVVEIDGKPLRLHHRHGQVHFSQNAVHQVTAQGRRARPFHQTLLVKNGETRRVNIAPLPR